MLVSAAAAATAAAAANYASGAASRAGCDQHTTPMEDGQWRKQYVSPEMSSSPKAGHSHSYTKATNRHLVLPASCPGRRCW
jgi:hypothetical protein